MVRNKMCYLIKQLSKFFLALVLITGWIFSSWPQIWQNPRVPPEIKKAHAAGAAISYIGQCTGTTSCTPPAHQVGDLFLVACGRNSTTGLCTIPSPWVSVANKTINGSSTADSSLVIACKVATTASETITGFTNGTSLVAQIYRGQHSGLTAACTNGGSIIGTVNFFATAANTTSTTETFNTVTNGDASSWDVGFGYAPAATAGITTAPAGMTNRSNAGTIMGGHDTNGTTSAFNTANVTLTTAGRIITGVVEIKASVLADPTLDNGTATYNNTVNVTPTLSDGSKGCYTTNGSTPAATTPGTCSTGTTWNTGDAAISITTTGTTLKILATKAAWTNSAVVSATYTLQVANPNFGTNGGSFNNDTTTSFSSATSDAVFCSTLDGSTPAASTPGTCSAGATGASATAIATGTAVKVLGTKVGYVNSAVQTSNSFTLTVGAITSSPGAGTYTSAPQSVTLNIATTTGAVAHYTTDGSAVTCSSTTYSGAFNISTTTTVKAIGCKTNYVSDTAISDLYTINISAPTVSTQATSSVEESTATGNGTIEATGGQNASAWGVCYKTASPCTISDNVAAGSGSGGTGAFTASITGLSAGTTYYSKAYATNSGGTSYGSEITFITKPAAPTSLYFTSVTATTLRLNWTASVGAVSYKVERCSGSGCSNFSQIASGVTTIYYYDSSLTCNTLYRYKVRATNATPADGAYSSIAEQTTGSCNSAPSFSGNPTDSPDPIVAGYNVTFSATANDTESNGWYLAVCKTNSITAGGPPTCDTGQTYCVSSSAVASGSQNTCTWTSSGSTAQNWYAFACDNNASPACSSANTVNSPITVNAVAVSVSVSPTSNNYGTIAINEVRKADTANANDEFILTNTGNVAEDFDIISGNAIGGAGWTLSATATGPSIFMHAYSTLKTLAASFTLGSVGDHATSWVAMDNDPNYRAVASNVAINGTTDLVLELLSPTGMDDFGVSKNILVTIRATQH